MEFIIMTKNKVMTWPTKKLGEVCDFIFGYSFKAGDFNEAGRGLPVIRIGDIDKGITEKFYDKEYDNRYLVEKGDILIGLSGTIKVDKWRGKKALLNQRIVKICDFKPEVLEDFIFYQLPQILKRLEIQISEGTVKNVLLPHLSNLKILVPPLSIQRQIVERLDAIKKAQELNDKQIALADELFQSLLHRELKPKGKKWEIKKLGEICEVARGGSPRPINNYLTKSSGGINWIKIGDVKEGEKYITSTAEKIKPEGISKTRLVKEGDLILSNSMSFGRPYILKISGAIHDGWLLLHIKNKSGLSHDFLYYILGTTQTKTQFEKAASGGVVRNLNTDLVKKVKIPLPPIETQRKIVEKLSAVQEYKKKLIEQKQLLQELFDSVLNKSFKGQL